MSQLEPAFRANVPAVAHEAFEGETILIHFESGRYYSLNPTGSAVWSELLAGATLDRLAARFAAEHGTGDDTVRAELARFLDELVAEGLAVAATGISSPPPDHAAAATAGDRAPFVAPRVEVFTDMQDLLLLDPIHEVDEAGWPHARK